MPQKQEEQVLSEDKVTNSSRTQTEECRQISDKCDVIVKKIKNKPRTKKRAVNE